MIVGRQTEWQRGQPCGQPIGLSTGSLSQLRIYCRQNQAVCWIAAAYWPSEWNKAEGSEEYRTKWERRGKRVTPSLELGQSHTPDWRGWSLEAPPKADKLRVFDSFLIAIGTQNCNVRGVVTVISTQKNTRKKSRNCTERCGDYVTRSLSFWFARKYGRNRPDT